MQEVPTKPSRTELEEWRMTLQTAQHFNDLLLRVRAFGLPLIVTVAGAGFALGLNGEIRGVEQWVVATLITLSAAVLPGGAVYLLHREGWGTVPNRASGVALTGALEGSERLLWWLAILVGFFSGAAYWALVVMGHIDLGDSETFSTAPLVLLFAVAVLLALYFLDRFYYYKLLLGAVNRASHLEKRFGFRLTDTITEITAPRQSATIVTLLYFIPGILACTLVFLFVVLDPELGQLPTSLGPPS